MDRFSQDKSVEVLDIFSHHSMELKVNEGGENLMVRLGPVDELETFSLLLDRLAAEELQQFLNQVLTNNK